MSVPKLVALDEDLGRDIFSSKHAKRARRSRVPYHVFLERCGERKISVDRLSVAPANESEAIADRTARARGRSFYGWAVVRADTATSDGRRVLGTPLPDNPYHADIQLPARAADDRDEQKWHAKFLASRSHWRGRER